MAAEKALYWELVSEEELEQPTTLDGDVAGGAPISPALRSWYQVVPAKDGDLLVFEGLGRRSQLRRWVASGRSWSDPQELSLTVHAAVPSPANPEKVCILHCPSHWGSDHRYEVYSLDTAANDSDPVLEPLFVSLASKADRQQLVEAGIAPKKRHGFSLAPFGCSLYFLCGLQHFPGDATGSFVYCFSLDEHVWTEVEYEGTFPATSPGRSYAGCRFGQSCVVHGGKAWLFGGCIKSATGSAEPTNGLFTFDLTEHRWEEVTSASSADTLWPPPMSGHGVIVCSDRMFVFGGDDGSQDIYSYDIATSQWSLLPPILLGPNPEDGRVSCCISGGSLMAYQQRSGQEDAAGDSEPLMWQELFAVGVDDLSGAVEQRSKTARARGKTAGPQELDFLGDESSADAAFMIDGVKTSVHRAVLQRFAPALARLFGSELGGPQRLVVLKGVQGSAFQLLLQHIYSRFAQALGPSEAEVLLELATHFELTTLVRRCEDSIVIEAGNVRHFLGIALSARPPLEVLNHKCIEYLTSHPEHLSLVKSPARDRLVSGKESPELQSARVLARSRAASELPAEASAAHQQHLHQHLHQHLQQQLQQLNQLSGGNLRQSPTGVQSGQQLQPQNAPPAGKARPEPPLPVSPAVAKSGGAGACRDGGSLQAPPLREAAAAASAAVAAASVLLREQQPAAKAAPQPLLQATTCFGRQTSVTTLTTQQQMPSAVPQDAAPGRPAGHLTALSTGSQSASSQAAAQAAQRSWRHVVAPGFTVVSSPHGLAEPYYRLADSVVASAALRQNQSTS